MTDDAIAEIIERAKRWDSADSLREIVIDLAKAVRELANELRELRS